jgi:hypothetical protein
MDRRTYESPATPAQRRYIDGLLESRLVPDRLYWQVRHAMGTLTDGDCRKFIPDLEECDYRESGRAPRRWGGNRFCYDDSLMDYEDYRDSFDGIAGHPMNHGSH